jgi:flagellar hook assembly protein FlgD
MDRTPALICHAAAGAMTFAVSGMVRQKTLVIFDLRGTAVRKIPMDIKASVFWDGRDSRGHRVPPGVYAAALQGCSALSFVYGDGKP